MERDEYEEDLERAANRKLMDETMRSQMQNGPDSGLQPPTPKRKVKVRKVRRQSIEVSGIQAQENLDQSNNI